MKKLLIDIKHWFLFITKRKSIKLVKESLVSYPYDWVYFLNLQKVKLEQMLEYFTFSQVCDNNQIIKYIKICINLIDIITDNNYVKPSYINYNNMHRFISPVHTDYYKDFQCEYYAEKAKALYFNILNNKLFTWWD